MANATNYVDNSVTDNGVNNWIVGLYQPNDIVFGPIRGKLSITKDFHTIYAVTEEDDYRNTAPSSISNRTVASFPSQNVAFVLKEDLYKKQK